MNYVLDGHNPVEEPDIFEWAKQCEKREWPSCVGRTDVGPFVVFTSFLGVDHAFGNGPPILFETMITKYGEWIDYQEKTFVMRMIDDHYLRYNRRIARNRYAG